MDTIPSRPSSPEPVRVIIPWWVWIAGAAAAFIATIFAWAYLYMAPMPDAAAETSIPFFTVFPAPTFTPVPPTETWTPDISPTAIPPSLAPGTIGIGANVEVFGTSGYGLQFHDAPSTRGKVLFVALERELFKIIDGPRVSEGFNWWLLEGLLDSSRQGWAVENYLRPTTP